VTSGNNIIRLLATLHSLFLTGVISFSTFQTPNYDDVKTLLLGVIKSLMSFSGVVGYSLTRRQLHAVSLVGSHFPTYLRLGGQQKRCMQLSRALFV
jgi:hypothetical protein